MKKLSFIIFILINSFILFSQNFILIHDYSKNFSNNYFINFIFEYNDSLVISNNIKKTKQNISSFDRKNGKNIIDFNYKIYDYCINKISNDIYLIGTENKGKSILIKQFNNDFKNIFEKKIIFSNKYNNYLVQTDDEGNIYISGEYTASFQIEGQKTRNSEETDLFILKFDKKGDLDTLYTLNTKGNKNINDFLIKDNKIYLTGSFKGIFVNDIQSKGRKDVFVLVLNLYNFKILKTITIGSLYDDEGQSLQIDSIGNLYLIGNYSGSLFFKNSILKNEGAKDIFICKYNRNLKLEWHNSFGTSGNDYYSDCSISPQNGIFITGLYRININDDSVRNKDNLYFNSFILKYLNSGKRSFIYTINDSISNIVKPSILFTSNKTILTTGNIEKSSKNKNYIYEFVDCYYSKKIELPEKILLKEDSILYYEAPDNFYSYHWSTGENTRGIFFSQPGLYSLTVKDSIGCISIDTIIVKTDNTSIIDETSQSKDFTISIFPNPTQKDIFININSIDIKNSVQIFLISSIGKIVYYSKIDNPIEKEKYTISININSGIYTVKIINGNKKYSKKIVVDK